MFPIPRLSLYLGVALLLAFVAIGYNYQRAERFQAEKQVAIEQRDAAQGALESQNAAVEQCAEASRKLFNIATEQDRAINMAADQIELLNQDLVTTRAELRDQEDRDHEIPACEIVLQTDLSVCPGHAASVRQRASRSLQRSGGGSPAPRANADRPASGSRL
jgi:hypothetical protein